MNLASLLHNAYEKSFKAKRWLALGALAFSFFGSTDKISAIQPDTFFDFYGGYRTDRLTVRWKAEGTTPFDFFVLGLRDEDRDLFKEKIKVKRQNIAVAGGRFQIRFCDYFFLKGYGQYGWITSGQFHQERTDRHLNDKTFISNIGNDSRCRDASIGFGYLYPIRGYWGCMGIGPAIGYSYDDQRYRMGSFSIFGFNEDDPDFDSDILHDLNFVSRWSGPWLGLDFVIQQQCNWKVKSSLEYHWATWHGEWRLQRPDVKRVIFSKRYKSHDADGIVWTIAGQYDFWQNWHVGLEYKWQFWKTGHGHVRPKDGGFTQEGFPWIEQMPLKHTRWFSDTITLYLGLDW